MKDTFWHCEIRGYLWITQGLPRAYLGFLTYGAPRQPSHPYKIFKQPFDSLGHPQVAILNSFQIAHTTFMQPLCNLKNLYIGLYVAYKTYIAFRQPRPPYSTLKQPKQPIIGPLNSLVNLGNLTQPLGSPQVP